MTVKAIDRTQGDVGHVSVALILVLHQEPKRLGNPKIPGTFQIIKQLSRLLFLC